jgi:acyl-CoA-binding protein/acyl carrier protein
MSNLVRFGGVDIPEDKLQLKIYGLEKQSLLGDCQEAEPNPILHPRQYIQWQAWNQYRGMSSQEAMQLYSQLVATLPQRITKSGKKNSDRLKERDIQAWLISYLAELLEMPPDEIEITLPFQRYGLSSAQGSILIGDLEAWSEYKLSPALMYEYPTIKALAAYIVEHSEAPK